MYILVRFLVYSASHRVDRKLLACKDGYCTYMYMKFLESGIRYSKHIYFMNHNTRGFNTSHELNESFDKVCITQLHLVNKIDVLVKHKCP